MDEIIDLIIDFEKRFVNLFKHLWTNPKAVVDSVVTKDKKYLSSFKFYSLIFSIWIVLIQLTNNWFEVFIQNPILPQIFVEFQQSYQSFVFFVAPFTFLIAWIIPFGILNFFLNRKPKRSLLTHVKLATIKGGMVLLIILPQIAIIAIWATYFEISYENFGIYLTQLLLIATPTGFILHFAWRTYQPKLWASLKTLVISIFITALAFKIIFDSEIQSYVFKNIVYSNFIKYDLQNNQPSFVTVQSITDEKINEKINTLPGKSANLRIVYKINLKTDSVNFFLERSTSIDSKLFPISSTPLYNQNSNPRWFGEELNDSSLLVSNSCRCQNVVNLTWLVNPKSESVVGVTQKLPTLPSSRFWLNKKNALLFSGVSNEVPLIGRVDISKNEYNVLCLFENKKKYQIDNWLIEENGDSFSLEMTLFKNQSERLEDIDYLTGEIINGEFKKRHELKLFQNTVSPNYNFYGIALHNLNLLKPDSVSSLISYQVMTDSAFKIFVHNIDVVHGEEKWQHTFSIPADFAVYKHAFVDSGRLILLGQAATFFSRSQLSNSIHNFILTIDLFTGQMTSLVFFRPTSHTLYDLEDLYLQGPAYQDDNFIYWDMYNGRERLILDKTKI